MANETSRFYGWRVVGAAFTIAVFGWGLGFYGPPVYLDTVVRTRGWSLATASGAVTLHFLVGALVVVKLPALHRRYGLAAVTIAGAVLLACGVLGWALASAPWQLYAATILSGAGWPALGAAAVNAIVSPWFVRKRPSALSTAYNGASIGGVIFSPLWVALIAWIGFAPAATLVGGFMLVIIAALAVTVLRTTPDGLGQLPDGQAPSDGGVTQPLPAGGAPVGKLSRDPAFLTLSLGMALALFAQIGLLAHLVSLLSPSLGVQGAGFAAGLSTAAAILGRQLVGWFMPAHADRRAVASSSLMAQMLGCLCLFLAAPGPGYGVIAGVVLIGVGIGNATSLPPLIAQVEFSKQDAARVIAGIVATSQAAYAFAPAAFGLIRETVSEHALYPTAIVVQLAAIAAYMVGRRAYASRSRAAYP
ncbi:MAG: MFS transporter [Microvirga sp.]